MLVANRLLPTRASKAEKDRSHERRRSGSVCMDQEQHCENDEQEEQVDDWNLALDFHLFVQHEPRKIYSPSFRRIGDDDDDDPQNTFMEVECVEALTPLDMMSLGAGTHDATGHCVWTGAFLLIESLQALAEYFDGKNVLELGCGTGIGGIALLRSRRAFPSHVVLTDADPEALELSRRNCKRNKLSSTCYTVAELTWGNAVDDMRRCHSPPSTRGFDTVVATDVLYDVGLLPALFQTVVDCLSGSQNGPGVFVLSHVPRACYSSENPPVSNLEEYIVARVKEFGLELKQILKPSDLSSKEEEKPDDALNDLSLDEMEQLGAAILVFCLSSVGGEGNPCL